MTSAAQAQAHSGPFAVLRRRPFALLWTGQLISTIGSSLTSIAASILVYRLTGSALAVGLMLIATAAPSLAIGLIAGVFVDRLDRRFILIASDLLRAVLVFLIPVFYPMGIAWLYVIVFASSAVTTFFDPAFDSVLPELAPDEELAAANSLMAISQFGSTALGFAAAGLIASQISIEWAFWLDAASFVFSAACIAAARLAPSGTQEETSVSAVFSNLKSGIAFLGGAPILRSLLLASLSVYFAFGLWNSLLLPFSERALHATEFEYGLQEGLTSVGFVAGSLLLAGFANRLREGQWIALSFLAMAVISCLYAVSTNIPIAIALVMISGFANAPSFIGRRLIVQRHTPRNFRGRVNSGFAVVRNGVFLVGMAAAGLADTIDVRVLVFSSGLFTLAAGVLALVLPGLGQPAAEWRRSVSLLRAADSSAALGPSRLPTLEDVDVLVGLVPAIGGLGEGDREMLLDRGRVLEVPAGTAIVHRGDASSSMYFVLSGRTVAGIADGSGEFRNLSAMLAGDYFGEIAALTGSPRTADVVADEDTRLLEVPAETMRRFMSNDVLNKLVLATMSERLARTYSADLPRLAGLDPADLRSLRTPTTAPAVTAGPAPASPVSQPGQPAMPWAAALAQPGASRPEALLAGPAPSEDAHAATAESES